MPDFATATYLLLYTVLGWFATLTGVALGGFLVYRTRRDTDDPLFASQKERKGEAFVIDDGLDPDVSQEPTPIQEEIGAINNRFVDQFASRLGLGGKVKDETEI